MSVLLAALTFSLASGANAATVLTAGANSAVSTVDASADFESTAALFGNPYIEGGLSFSRTNLTFNNNGCGFAGCSGIGGTLSGNYMYGTSSGNGVLGFFEIGLTSSELFGGLELVISSGNLSSFRTLEWETFLGGSTVSSGSSTIVPGSIIGWLDNGSGFDTLRFTVNDSAGDRSAPAFDSVRAQFFTAATVVPVPAAFPLLVGGLGILGFMGWRRKRAA